MDTKDEVTKCYSLKTGTIIDIYGSLSMSSLESYGYTIKQRYSWLPYHKIVIIVNTEGLKRNRIIVVFKATCSLLYSTFVAVFVIVSVQLLLVQCDIV